MVGLFLATNGPFWLVAVTTIEPAQLGKTVKVVMLK
jgi:hypothetical protein